MKSKLEKTLERTTIGFMTLGTIVSIILAIKSCKYKPIPKKQESSKEIKITYNTTHKKSVYILPINNSYNQKTYKL